MKIRVAPSLPSRPCDFCLGLQDDSVFSDFSLDNDERVFLERISFDGYGCHSPIQRVEPMCSEDSKTLIAEIQNGTVDGPNTQRVLRDYFESIRNVLWEAALLEHDLVEEKPDQSTAVNRRD